MAKDTGIRETRFFLTSPVFFPGKWKASGLPARSMRSRRFPTCTTCWRSQSTSYCNGPGKRGRPRGGSRLVWSRKTSKVSPSGALTLRSKCTSLSSVRRSTRSRKCYPGLPSCITRRSALAPGRSSPRRMKFSLMVEYLKRYWATIPVSKNNRKFFHILASEENCSNRSLY